MRHARHAPHAAPSPPDYVQALQALWPARPAQAPSLAPEALAQSLLRQLAAHSRVAFALSDCVEGRWLYVSDNFERVTSYARADIMAEGRNFFPARTHPADAEQLMAHLPQVHRRTGELAVLGAHDFDISFCYRIRRADGALMWLHEQLVPLQCAAAGVQLCLNIAHDISALKADEVVSISAQAQLRGQPVVYCQHRSNARLLASFTARELETLRLLAQGFTSKEAARRMGIELATAVTYRKTLLRKTRCHNIAQLLQLAQRQALL